MELLKLFGKKEEKSKNVAKERLKLVLVHDRADLSPKLLDMMKADIIRIISEYVEVEENGIDIKLTRMKREDSTTMSALVANIPIVNVRDK